MNRYFFLVGSLLFSVVAKANYFCVGDVSYLGVSSDGTLASSNGFGVHYLCNVSEDSCKVWSSLITAAKLTDRQVRFYYQNSTRSGENGEYCSSIGDWLVPEDNVYHIELL